MKILHIKKILQKPFFNFLFKLLIFILIVFILDLSIGSMLRYFYFKQHNGFLYRTTYTIEETTAELLIFGASKANHQYSPEIFEKRLNLSYYNAGRDGSSIFYHYAVLKSVLKRYTPKMIILDISRDFEKNQGSYDRISMLLPYYKSHPEMRSIIEMKSPYEKFKLISRIYPYNSLLFSITAGNSEFNKERYAVIKGYVPLLRVWEGKLQTLYEPTNYKLDSVKISIYESFITDCIKAGVKLYVVSSPDFFKLNYNEKSNIVGEQIANKYNLKFLNYSNDSLFLNNAKYFADLSHLNDNGAKVFSNLIIDDIEKDMNANTTKDQVGKFK
jgi:predicted peroxiredoxin